MIRLLVEGHVDLVAGRTCIISRLRWHWHELGPAWAAAANPGRASALACIKSHLDKMSGIVSYLVQRLLILLRPAPALPHGEQTA